MPALFDSHIWVVAKDVLIALALIKVIVSIYRKPQPKKLAYDLLLNERLSALYKIAASNIQARHSSQSIAQGHVLLIKLINCGHIPITTVEYVRPVSISFGNQAKIVAATITDEYPLDLSATIRISGDTIQLEPLLLNPNDRLTLEVIVDAEKPRVTFNSRIVGIHKISSRAPTPVQDTVMLLGLLCMFLGILIRIYAKDLSSTSEALVIIGGVAILTIARLYLPLRQLRFKEQVIKRYR